MKANLTDVHVNINIMAVVRLLRTIGLLKMSQDPLAYIRLGEIVWGHYKLTIQFTE